MKIYIQPSGHRIVNMGDLAMLQVAVSRLNQLWPDSDIFVYTQAPERLAQYCPKTKPVNKQSLDELLRERYLFPEAWYKKLPDKISYRLGYFESILRRRHPRLSLWLQKMETALYGEDRVYFEELQERILGSDCVIVTGQGGMTDAFVWNDLRILRLLDIAHSLNKTTIMLGQGMGPVQNKALLQTAFKVLPKVDFIALREKRSSLPFLQKMGVALENTIVTGDDAVQMAYEARATQIGNAIGVNLRVAEYAAVNTSLVEPVRRELHSARRKYRTDLLPVPIALPGDMVTSADIIGAEAEEYAHNHDLNSPLKIIQQINHCRVVVTGSYHAGVFALSQGVPVVALAKSPYYIDKFLGLADQFRVGCEVVLLEGHNVEAALAWALDTLWEQADAIRENLLAAAVEQIEAGWIAYRHVYDLVDQSLDSQHR